MASDFVVHVTMTEPMAMYLDDLIGTGLYGQTRTTAARHLLERAIEGKILSGLLARRAGTPAEETPRRRAAKRNLERAAEKNTPEKRSAGGKKAAAKRHRKAANGRRGRFPVRVPDPPEKPRPCPCPDPKKGRTSAGCKKHGIEARYP